MDSAMKSRCLSNTLAFLGLASGIRYSMLRLAMLILSVWCEKFVSLVKGFTFTTSLVYAVSSTFE